MTGIEFSRCQNAAPRTASVHCPQRRIIAMAQGDKIK
jgi:hypothetical protein